MPSFDEAIDLNLQSLNGRVDITHRAAAGAFLAEHMPRLQSLTQLKRHAAMLDAAEDRKTKLKLRLDHSGSKS